MKQKQTILKFLERHFKFNGKPANCSAVYPYLRTYLQKEEKTVLEELKGWSELAILKNKMGHHYFLPMAVWKSLAPAEQSSLLDKLNRKYKRKEKPVKTKAKKEVKNEMVLPSWLDGKKSDESYGF